MSCNIRKDLIARYGERAGCAMPDNIQWIDCESECKHASACPECGDNRISCWDPCAGRTELCLNPDCGMDK